MGAAAEVLSNHDLPLINRVVKDPHNVVFGPGDFRLEGCEEEINAYYRLPSVGRRARVGRIRVTAPRAGRFYPGLIVYDADGRERFVILAAGRRLGEAVADWDNARQRLFFVSDPVDFKGGEEIEIQALGEQGNHRVESVLLFERRPEPKEFSFQFLDVGWFGNTLAWRTNWPAACTLEFDGRTIRESVSLNNHRAVLDGVTAGREYRYRITAARFDGKPASTGWRTIRIPVIAPPDSAGEGTVSLTVEAPGSPVTAGIPFHKGVLASDAHLRLIDAHGAEVGLQTRTLARWEDGSVKWVLLDFKTRKDSRVKLEYGPRVRRRDPSGALRVAEEPAGVTVSTGPLAFRIDARQFGFVDWIDAGGARVTANGRRSAFYLTGAKGALYDSLGAPDEVVVEERGPVRACVRVSGRHRSAGGGRLFRYVVRFRTWAGERAIRVQPTFEQDSGESEFSEIARLVLRIPLAGRNRETGAIRVRRDDDRRSGLVRWRSGGSAVTLSVRDFWQNYPKDLAAEEQGLEFGICPRLDPNQYSFARGTVDEHRLYYYLRDGRYRFRQGASKTHEFWIGVGEDSPPTSVSMAAAPAEWYARSGALGHLALPSAGERVVRYDAAFARAFQEYLRARETDRAYGMMNFGDWWGEREINWGNCEYDTQHALFLQFVRTGDWRYFRAGEQAEWHNRDIDTAHYHTDPLRAGGVWEHKVGHTGGYFPGHSVPLMAEAGDMTASHTFVEGHFDYYFLTGDARSLETARRTADLYCGPLGRNFELISCRHGGWLMTLAVAAYNATSDPYYLNFAHSVFERVLELQTEDGGWRRKLARGHCDCLPRHMGNVAFMMGILSSGLRMYYETTGDERAAESIVKAARFLVADMWMPAQESFRYTSCPRTSASSSGYLALEGLAFAYKRTGDAALLAPLRLSVEKLLSITTGFGKSFSQATRQAPRFIDY
jgi:hypothetical protein